MKIQFVLSEKTNISSFVYCLKLLHGNFTEVLFNFNESGLSLSQFWEDKNTDRGKYLIFFDTSFFSKISCQRQSILFKMNIKDILQKLKSHKKDIQEIFMTITNQKKNGDISENWCLVEFMISLDRSGTIVYRNGCEIEKPSRNFSPLAYYQCIHADKQRFFVVEPSKLGFLEVSKNEFVEITLSESKVEFLGSTNKQKFSIKPGTCFNAYDFGEVSAKWDGVNTLMNPPHHLQRYAEVCTKSNKDMCVYTKGSVSEEGSVKFYCPVKSEHFLFILKFKMKVCENRPTIPNSFPVSVTNRVPFGLDTGGSMSHNIHPSPSDVIPAIRHSLGREPKMSYQQPPASSMFPNSNSSPNFFASDPVYEPGSQVGNHKRKKNDFQLSQQDTELKKMKRTDEFEEEDGPPFHISLAERESHRMLSGSNSMSNGHSLQILAEKEPFSQSEYSNRETKQEYLQRGHQKVVQQRQPNQQIVSTSNHKQERAEVKKPIVNGGGGMDFAPKSEHKPLLRTSTDRNKNPFEVGVKLTGLSGSDLSKLRTDTFPRELLSTAQTHKVNEDFSKKIKDTLREMKL